jgi:Transglutaminase-like superfamily
MRAGCLLLVFVVGSCAGSSRGPQQEATSTGDGDPGRGRAQAPAGLHLDPELDAERWFDLTTASGARLGWAREALEADGDELAYERDDWVAIRRGDAPALIIETHTRVTGTAALAREVTVERRAGQLVRQLVARRGEGEGHGEVAGWTLWARDGAGQVTVTRAPGETVPSPWLVVRARAGTLPERARVMLTDRDGALVTARLERRDGGKVLLTLETAFGSLEQTWRLDGAGRIEAIEAAGGSAERTTRDAALAAFEPMDVLAGLPGAGGAGGAGGSRPRRISVSPPTLADLAPTLLQRSDAAAIRAFLPPSRGGSERVPELVGELADLTNQLLVDKSTAGAPMTATEALAARGGDCNAHAHLLGAFLRASGVPTRVVTGWVLGDEGWRLHRWTAAWVTRPHHAPAWLELDATGADGGDPAGLADPTTHIALAIHGATPEALLIDDSLPN